MKKYIVKLTEEEREELKDIVSNGKRSARTIKHANILLKADTSPKGNAWQDERICNAFCVSVRTVERIRQLLVTDGMDAALRPRKKARARSRRLDGDQEAQLVVIACSEPPEGRARWTLRLLRDKTIELGIVDSICVETIRQTLKKTNLNRGKRKNGLFPPRPMRRSSVPWKMC